MIKRIVQMEFIPEKVAEFRELFSKVYPEIIKFQGCSHLELWEDEMHPHTLFTFSFWESNGHLQAYRNSAFFEKTWADTKILFAAKPRAWSVKVIYPAPGLGI